MSFAGLITVGWDPDTVTAINIDEYASPSLAYDALVAQGGGRLLFTAGKTYSFTEPLIIDQDVACDIIATGAIIIPPSDGSGAIKFNYGHTPGEAVTMTGGTFNGTTVGGNAGSAIAIIIADSYGVTLLDVDILSCATGILFTGITKWSEGSSFDRLVISDCLVGIDFELGTGSGSYGYANWGLVHIDDIPNGGIGIQQANGCGFTVSTITRLVMHTSEADSTMMSVSGDMGNGVKIFAAMESLSTQSNQIGLDVAATAVLNGGDIQLAFYGTWTAKFNNPNDRANQVIIQYQSAFYPQNPKANNWYYASSPGSNNTAIPSITQPRVSLVYIPWQVEIQALLAEFTAAGSADSVFRIGIWSPDQYGFPFDLILDAGSISTGTGDAGDVPTGGVPGVYAITLANSLILPRGWYGFGGACQGTTSATMRTISAQDVPQAQYPLGTGVPPVGGSLGGYFGANQAGAFGAFTTPGNVSSIPRIGYKVAA